MDGAAPKSSPVPNKQRQTDTKAPILLPSESSHARGHRFEFCSLHQPKPLEPQRFEGFFVVSGTSEYPRLCAGFRGMFGAVRGTFRGKVLDAKKGPADVPRTPWVGSQNLALPGLLSCNERSGRHIPRQPPRADMTVSAPIGWHSFSQSNSVYLCRKKG